MSLKWKKGVLTSARVLFFYPIFTLKERYNHYKNSKLNNEQKMTKKK